MEDQTLQAVPPPRHRRRRQRQAVPAATSTGGPGYDSLIRRLNRIEGQVRSVRGMVEKECYCTDILTQVSAIQSALNAFSRELLSNHIHSCVVQDIQNGHLEVVDDLLVTIQKLMK